MITMQKLGVVKKVPSEEKAALLEKQGFQRVGGAADPVSDRPATMKDLQAATEAIYAHMSETFQKMGEAMYERLHSALMAAAPEKPKTAKASKKEEPHGGADQPDRADGAKYRRRAYRAFCPLGLPGKLYGGPDTPARR